MAEESKSYINNSDEEISLYSGIPVRPGEAVVLDERQQELNAGLIDGGELKAGKKAETQVEEKGAKNE